MTFRHMLQRNFYIKFLGNPQSGKHILCFMGMHFQRHFPAQHRNHGLQFHIKGRILGPVLPCRIFFAHILSCFEEQFTENGSSSHAGAVPLIGIVTLRIFTKSTFHSHAISDEHIIHSCTHSLDGCKGAAHNIGAAGTDTNGGHTSLGSLD